MTTTNRTQQLEFIKQQILCTRKSKQKHNLPEYTLAEIMRTLDMCSDDIYYITSFGDFFNGNSTFMEGKICRWDFSKNLDDQKDPVISFLYNSLQ